MNKANSIINKFLLAGDRFMPELIYSILLLQNTVHVDNL